eukprot:1027595_1
MSAWTLVVTASVLFGNTIAFSKPVRSSHDNEFMGIEDKERAFNHWHGMIMFIGFGFVLPLSMIFFYFGASCSLSLKRRYHIHYIGTVLTFALCLIGIAVHMAMLDEYNLRSHHAMIGLALFCTMFVCILVFCIMRLYRWGLQIWCDFILCFSLLCWSFYEIANGLLMEDKMVIDNAHHYIKGLIAWFSIIVTVFITLSIWTYLTTGISMVMVHHFGPDEKDFDLSDGTQSESESCEFSDC